MSGFKTVLKVFVIITLILLVGFLVGWGVTYLIGEDFIIGSNADDQLIIEVTDTTEDYDSENDGNIVISDDDLVSDIVLSPGENANVVF